MVDHESPVSASIANNQLNMGDRTMLHICILALLIVEGRATINNKQGNSIFLSIYLYFKHLCLSLSTVLVEGVLRYKNQEVDTVGHLGFCRRCGIAGGERVPRGGR